MVKKSWSLGGAAVLLVALLAVLAAPSLLRAKLRACVPFHLFAIPLVAAVIAHAYLGTVANPGTMPRARSPSTPRAASARTACANALPSRIVLMGLRVRCVPFRRHGQSPSDPAQPRSPAHRPALRGPRDATCISASTGL